MEEEPEFRRRMSKIVKDVLPDPGAMPVEEAMKLVRAEVYRRLKRLEAAEILLSDVRDFGAGLDPVQDPAEWSNLVEAITQFLAEGVGNG